MLTTSDAFSDLRQRSLVALGSEKQESRLGLPLVFEIYTDGIVRLSKSRFRVVVVEPLAQAAFIADLESVLDRFVLQLATYGLLVDRGIDPAWTAVTGYYAAFFAASSLLLSIGICNRQIPATGVLPAGIYHVTGTVVGAGSVQLEARSTSVSHAVVWQKLMDLIHQLLAVPTLDNRSRGALEVLLRLVSVPGLVSQVRNEINYSIDQAIYVRAPWACEVRHVASPEALEIRLSTGPVIKDEARVELVLLGCASLAAALYNEYLGRPGKRDKRRADRRRAILTDHPVEWIRSLAGWLA